MTNIILYETPQGKINIQVRFENETFWLTQKAMAELFRCSTDNISLHLKNIFKDGELNANSVTEEYSATASDGKNYKTKFYSLDAIIAVGYRVNSLQATQFRIWATKTLREYIIKGFVLDDERLKQGKQFGRDYFDELLARIRDIRASEKRFYQKIKDLFALSEDYKFNQKETDQFFAQVQNKLLFAVTKHTAAELILSRAKATLPNMGLTTFKGSRVRKEDIYIAKNYLTEKELDTLNRMVTLFLDTAELRVQDQIPLNLEYWKMETEKVIAFSNKPILKGQGTISHAQMEKKVSQTYLQFDTNRKKIEAQAEDEAEQEAINQLIKRVKKRK